MNVDLPDGRQIVIRPIRASDRVHLDHGLERLSPETRRLRFHGDRKTFTSAELDYLTACDGIDRIAIVAVGLDELGQEFEGVGVARAYRDPSRPDLAEVSLVVVDDWQRLGVGRGLLTALSETSRLVGIERWLGLVASENKVALRLFLSFGPALERRWNRGVLEATIKLNASGTSRISEK